MRLAYGARHFSPALNGLFKNYSADQSGCLLGVFQGSITCKIRKSHNRRCPSATSDVTGTGPGADWQRLTKACPAFATEYAAVVLRTSGGQCGEFGPLRKKKAEVRSECDSMLSKVQALVHANPKICSSLR